MVCSEARPRGADHEMGPTEYVGVMRCPEPRYDGEADLIGVCTHQQYCLCWMGTAYAHHYPRPVPGQPVPTH